MLTTLYCDASWYGRLQVGGWAVWLRSERGRIVEKGAAPDYCAYSYEAELSAIFAGIHLTTDSWPETEAILVRSDCEQALGLLTGKQQPNPDHAGACRLVERLRHYQDEHKFRLIPRWVKGHQNGNKTDAWLNRRVDRMARQASEYAARKKRNADRMAVILKGGC